MLIAVLIIFINSCVSDKSEKKEIDLKSVAGKIVQTGVYCGGANPSQEMLEYIYSERHFSNKKMYIREGINNELSKPIIKEFSSNEEGNFEIDLAQGKYCIISETKKERLNLSYFLIGPCLQVKSMGCLESWWHNCDKILEVGNEYIKNFTIKFEQICKMEEPCTDCSLVGTCFEPEPPECITV